MLRLPSPRLTALPREARDTLFLLGVIGAIVLLQSPQLPWWCTGFTLGILIWRGLLAWNSRPLPGRFWRLAAVLVSLMATWMTHRTLAGQEAGVTLIVLLLGLKTLELRARRDAFVIFFLGFFTLLTHFLYSQSLLAALGILLALLGLLTALVNAHMPAGRPSLWLCARQAGTLALLGMPVMLVLFMLFPRIGPLWGIPTDGLSGRSGLSSQMEIGQIARLALDDSIAFRLRFETPRPRSEEMYFRGPVLSHFDGVTWRPAYAPVASTDRLETTGPPVRYQVTQEPSAKPWIFVLEATPTAPLIPGLTLHMSPDLQWLARRPLTDVVRYSAESHPRFRHGLNLHPWQLREHLAMPAGFNPRTLELARQLRQQFAHEPDPPTALVRAVQERLRTGGYVYTLEPGLYGQHNADEFWFDRKAGFCEHIASSFVILMRALGIPARVVTGYQGGEANPVDGYWTVRQSDAHAWAEVWLAGRGWVRIDPTTSVAPSRTGTLDRLRPAPGLLAQAIVTFSPGLLMQLRSNWEAINNRWNQWVLNYTQSRQMDLLKQLGIDSPDWADLVLIMTSLAVLASLAGLAWNWREHWQHDPWLRLLEAARQRLARAGVPLPPQTTPRQIATILGNESGISGEEAHLLTLWLQELERQRYDPTHSSRPLKALQKQFRQLPWPRQRRS